MKQVLKSSESAEQQKVFEWAEIAMRLDRYAGLELMFHVPNEGKRSYFTGSKMKRGGLKSGVSDICIPVAKGGYHGFFIEMKYENNKLTKEQIKFLRGVKKNGYATSVCYSAAEAIYKIKKYFNLKGV